MLTETFLIIRHVASEGLGTIEGLLQEMGLSWEYHDVTDQKPLPSGLKSYLGYFVMGGPMGVYEKDKYPFLKEEIDFLKHALDRSAPVFGVCLGAQLLAAAGGAKVYKGDKKEVGWFPVQLTAEGEKDKVFSCLPEEFVAFHWHGDTFDLPPDSVLLASSSLYPHQAFKAGMRAYGIQFHLEMTKSMVEEWVTLNEDELKGADVSADSLLQPVSAHIESQKTLCHKLFRGFLTTIPQLASRKF